MIQIFQRFFMITLFTSFLCKYSTHFRTEQIPMHEAHEKVKNAKIYGIFESEQKLKIIFQENHNLLLRFYHLYQT